MKISIDQYIGKKINRWTIISANILNTKKWNCRCECGTEKAVNSYTVRNGISKSCGCLSSEIATKESTTHGLSKSSEYHIYRTMVSRCYNENNKTYKRYGGRGIKVCDRWLNSFENFIEDVGFRPGKGYSLERKDNEKGYSPENCVWADALTQGNNCRSNKIIIIDGQSKTMAQWARFYNIRYSAVAQRITKLKWDYLKAFTTPVSLGSNQYGSSGGN